MVEVLGEVPTDRAPHLLAVCETGPRVRCACSQLCLERGLGCSGSDDAMGADDVLARWCKVVILQHVAGGEERVAVARVCPLLPPWAARADPAWRVVGDGAACRAR